MFCFHTFSFRLSFVFLGFVSGVVHETLSLARSAITDDEASQAMVELVIQAEEKAKAGYDSHSLQEPITTPGDMLAFS
jgi:hypothetical protein